MCGITCYIGKDDAIKKALQGLKLLEYRGYDSSGIAYIKNKKIIIKKKEGTIENIERELTKNEKTNIAIAHTRWATHGKADKINAHPHKQGKITIVHNGIIENYNILKKELEEKGYIFKSSTDTEVVAALIDDLYKENKNMVETLHNLKKYLIGSYALGIINEQHQEQIFIIKKDSPLVIGIGKDENIVASDLTAISHITNKYMLLSDNEFAIITKNNVECFNENKQKIIKEIKIKKINNDILSKNNYEHFMLKEINEESKIVEDLLLKYTKNNKIKKIFNIKKYNNIDIVACGSAMYAGKIGKYYIEKYTNIKTNVYCASEYRYQKNFFNKDTLIILVSQSGETADTLAALRLAKNNNIDTLAIVNRKESTIAREADNIIYTEAGIEVSVATTKVYLAQVIIFLLLALQKTKAEKEEIQKLKLLPKIIENNINNHNYKKIANIIKEKEHIFYIGRGIDYYLAEEGSLKLKEISYIHSEAISAGELKHGSIALIDEKFSIIAIITDKKISDKTISNLKEISSRNAQIITISTINNYSGEYNINLEDNGDLLNPLSIIVVMQLIAYYTAKSKGYNIDKPRNLAKSVTVE